MARIFNISFSYGDITYSAMITSRITPFFTEYHITMLDDDLIKLLPSNKLVATGNEDLKFINVTPAHDSELMKQIIKAVKTRLQTVQV